MVANSRYEGESKLTCTNVLELSLIIGMGEGEGKQIVTCVLLS